MFNTILNYTQILLVYIYNNFWWLLSGVWAVIVTAMLLVMMSNQMVMATNQIKIGAYLQAGLQLEAPVNPLKKNEKNPLVS